MLYYRCTNYGSCPKANSRELIELPPGVLAVCPEPKCQKPLVEAPASPGSRGGKSDETDQGRSIRLLLIVIGVAVLLVGVVAWLVLGSSSRDLALTVEPARGRVGEGGAASVSSTIGEKGSAALPQASPGGPYDLNLVGSNTIGGVDASSQKGLARDLVSAFCKRHWPGGALLDDKAFKVPGKEEEEHALTYKLPTGELKRILIQPHGSKTAVDGLSGPGAIDTVGMSSTPRPELQNGFDEYVVALDAVAVIVNPESPIRELTLEQVRNIFGPNPTVTEWNGSRIYTFGRDTKSGTTESFRSFVGIDKELESLGRKKDALIPYSGVAAGQEGHEGYEDTSKIIEQIRGNKQAIGYVGRAANLPPTVRAVAVRPASGFSAFAPNSTTIRTMEYSMSRELYFYTRSNASSLVKAFIRFSKDDAGQAVADEAGFIGFSSSNLLAHPTFGDGAPQELKTAVAACDRVVISFRFRHGETEALDTLSAQNLRRLTDFLRLPANAHRKLVIVGCVDSSGTAQANQRVSEQRAIHFATLLENEGVGNPITKRLGFGQRYLLYDDKGDSKSREAQRNRRVDVYLER